MLELPFNPQHLVHRHGGKITAIHSMRHQANKARDGRSLDGWWYVGDVEWHDGTKSTNHPIDPHCLCYETDAGREEVGALSELMMEYLAEHGEWCDSKSKHEGWYAYRTKRVAA
jgi:hypothetical protein